MSSKVVTVPPTPATESGLAPAPDPVVVAAQAATTEALVRVAHLLDEVALAHARSARDVRAVWLGPHRNRFDAERARRDAELAGLTAACRRLAGR